MAKSSDLEKLLKRLEKVENMLSKYKEKKEELKEKEKKLKQKLKHYKTLLSKESRKKETGFLCCSARTIWKYGEFVLSKDNKPYWVINLDNENLLKCFKKYIDVIRVFNDYSELRKVLDKFKLLNLEENEENNGKNEGKGENPS